MMKILLAKNLEQIHWQPHSGQFKAENPFCEYVSIGPKLASHLEPLCPLLSHHLLLLYSLHELPLKKNKFKQSDLILLVGSRQCHMRCVPLALNWRMSAFEEKLCETEIS